MDAEIRGLISKMSNLILSLTALEITLIFAVLLLLWALAYVLKQWLILRHVFYTSSDWCALKINEISVDATEKIIELVDQIHEIKYSKRFDVKEARQYVSSSITNANDEWFAQKEKFQNRLEKNGQPRLGINDGWLSLGSRWYKN